MENLKQAMKEPDSGLARELFKAFFEHGLEACILSRPNGAVIAANTQACALFGYEQSEFIALDRAAVTLLDDPRLHKLLAERERHGTTRGQITMRRKDGSQIEVEIASSIFTLANGERYSTIIVRDLTAKLHAEKMLRESEERLRFALDAAGIGDWDMDLRTNVARRSLQHDICFGYDKPVEHWGYDTFLSHVHPSDRDRVDSTYRAAMAGNGEYDVEFKAVWPDGSIHWLWSRGSFYFDEAGAVYRVAGIQVDISERKRIEQEIETHAERLQFSLNAANMGHWDTDLATGEGFRSLSLFALFGFNQPIPQWDLNKFLDLLHSDDRDRVETAYKAATSSAGVFEEEFRVIWPDQSTHWMWSKARAYADAEGKPYRMLGLQMDITRRKDAELEVLRLNALLEKRIAERTKELLDANQDLEAYAYTVSHDLRAPLRAIDGYSAILDEELANSQNSEARNLLATIRQRTKFMNTLIEDLLELSRFSRHELQKQELDARQQVVSIIEELDDKERKATFEIGELPSYAADPVLMRQVWINLISNALKYSSKSAAPAIRVGFEDGAYFIEDNGAGFDMAHADNLFKVFSRLHDQKDYSGTGIGLAIVKRIIERHGGRVWATGEIGAGARFSFSFI